MELTLSKPGDNVLGWMAACLVTGLVLLVHRLTSRSPIEKFPLLGKQYGNARKRTQAFLERPLELYYEGYQSFRDQIYRLTMPDGQFYSPALESFHPSFATRHLINQFVCCSGLFTLELRASW